MLQLLTLLAMEPPVSFAADQVRDEKVKVLRSIPAPEPERIEEVAVRAQYAAGRRSAGEDVPGYLDEPDVPDDSHDRDLRRAAARGRQLALGRRAVLPAHGQAPRAQGHRDRRDAQAGPAPRASSRTGSVGVRPNELVLTVQPNEGVSLPLGAKIPGTRMSLRPVNMEFLYGTTFLSQSPEAYERLILDAMRGDATLFTRDDEVEAQWQIIDPVLKGWAALGGRPAAVRGRHAGPGGGAARCCSGEDRWRRDLTDALWSADGHHAGARSRRRCAAMEAERHQEDRAVVPRAC